LPELAEQCSYTTRGGARCRRRVAPGEDGCSIHSGIDDSPPAPGLVALVIDASGRAREVLLRAGVSAALDPDGYVHNFVDGEWRLEPCCQPMEEARYPEGRIEDKQPARPQVERPAQKTPAERVKEVLDRRQIHKVRSV
jgi:hypothetical protein